MLLLSGCNLDRGYVDEGEPTPSPALKVPDGVKYICYITDLNCHNGANHYSCSKYFECVYVKEWLP